MTEEELAQLRARHQPLACKQFGFHTGLPGSRTIVLLLDHIEELQSECDRLENVAWEGVDREKRLKAALAKAVEERSGSE